MIKMRCSLVAAVLLFATMAAAQRNSNGIPTPSTTTVGNFTVINNRYTVEGFPPACTVNSVIYTTQFDCAFQTAYRAA